MKRSEISIIPSPSAPSQLYPAWKASHLQVARSHTVIHTQGACQSKAPKAGGKDLIRVNRTTASCHDVRTILVLNTDGRPCFLGIYMTSLHLEYYFSSNELAVVNCYPELCKP